MNLLFDLMPADASSEAPFLTDLRTGVELSYAQLLDASRRVAGALRAREVGAGDRIVYFTTNRPGFFPLLFGAAARGATLVPVNERLTDAERSAILGDAEPALVLCDRRVAGGGAADGWLLVDELASGDPVLAGAEPCEPDQAALIIYTSGTTSASKGVILTHRNLTTMARTFVEFYRFASGQRFLCTLPFYHINAPMITGLACVAAGAQVYVTDPYGFTNARSIFDLVARHRINVLSLTPSIMASLLQLFPEGSEADLASLELALVGTAFLPETTWRRFEQTFGIPCFQGYGLTETTTWATMTPRDERKRYDSAGLPVGCEVAIDGDGRGEVLIRGDIVMQGYHRARAATKRAFAGDWFRTGDIGEIDADGQLRIVGRIKNIVKRRGVLLFPEEIDGLLCSRDDVAASCTVGIPDELVGERMMTAVQTEAAAAELRAFLLGQVSAHRAPDAIQPLAALPRNDVGKPDVRAVRRILSGAVREAILHAISRQKAARARPSSPPAVAGAITAALHRGAPLRFVGFWGVGTRREVAECDRVALRRLRQILDDVGQIETAPAVELTLLLADVHGRCNGVPEDRARVYLAGIDREARALGFSCERSSDVWRAAGLDLDAVMAHADDADCVARWEALELRQQLAAQAAKHGPDGVDADAHARRYHAVLAAENPVIARAFAGAIFFTYNGPEYRALLPELPIVYWHSLKPGVARKPWFEA